ncbi:MAG TPA: HAMP domain-containing sensor histidine kinase [Acidimicrobiales bacterium]
MADQTAPAPHRFRRRLTGAFVLVAAVSAGVVASVTFLLAREYRWRNVRNTTMHEARVALALAPRELDAEGFERLRAAYEPRTEADMVAAGRTGEFSSSPALTLADVPRALRGEDAPAESTGVRTSVAGRDMLVIGAQGPAGTRYYFFFSVDQVQDSLSELARVSVAGWALTVAVAGAIGQIVARTTLRPVGDVAGAAEAIAAGDLSARLPVASDDEFGALASSFNHMADEVQALVAKLEEAAHRQRQFTADVAHELRTPLTGMSATASVLAEMLDDLPQEARRSANVLIADVRRLRDLVMELLELSRLDAETEPLNVEPLRVADAVDAVLRGAELRRDAHVSVDAHHDVVVAAEPVRLRRILGNLIDNAIVHGDGPVTVRARRVGTNAVIDVFDDGPGIDEDDLPRVFDRFYKSDHSRAKGGSGLGLAIARQHALAQGGDLTVSNEPGGGARFSLVLPSAGGHGGSLVTPPRVSGAGD